ncbi:MAG: hypothetical protein Q9227_006835 [Pyrenula ochraceoflavens]
MTLKKSTAWLLSLLSAIDLVAGQGTVVYQFISYCPSPSSTLATGPGIPTGAGSGGGPGGSAGGAGGGSGGPTPTATLPSGSGSGTAPATSPSASDVLLTVQAARQKKLKRQAAASPAPSGGTYLAPDGTLTTKCQNGAAYRLDSYGHFFGDDLQISANYNETMAPFVGSETVGPINTTFALVDGYLQWTNPAFPAGSAQFCILDSTLEAVFVSTLPDGCSPVRIGSDPTTNCPGYVHHSGLGSTTGGGAGGAGATGGAGGAGGSTPSSPVEPTTTGSTPEATVSGSVFGMTTTSNPNGCFDASGTPPITGPNGTTVTTLEQCGDFCIAYDYWGMQDGMIEDIYPFVENTMLTSTLF